MADDEFTMSDAYRAELDKIIDCKAAAQEWMKERNIDPEWLKLVTKTGFDSEQSITQIDSEDYGNADGWYDTAQVHTIRYLPLKYLNEGDVSLLLNYDPGASPIIPLALAMLEEDPLENADFYDGHILSRTAEAIVKLHGAGEDEPPAPDNANVSKLRGLIQRAFDITFASIREYGEQYGLDAAEVIEGYRAGTLKISATGFREFADVLEEISNALNTIQDFKVFAVAKHNMLFQRSSETRDYELQRVAQEGDEALEDWDNPAVDYPPVVREVYFSIARAPGARGVRVYGEANPATVYANMTGEFYASAQNAMQDYQKSYGIPLDSWQVHEAD